MTDCYYSSLAEIKRANKARGQHWFDPGAMRFFATRLAPTVYGGRYFIASSQFCLRDRRTGVEHCDPRRYSIHEAHCSGEVDTVGEFQEHGSLSAAQTAVLALVRTQEEVANG